MNRRLLVRAAEGGRGRQRAAEGGLIELVVKEDHEHVLAHITLPEFYSLRNSMDNLAVRMACHPDRKSRG